MPNPTPPVDQEAAIFKGQYIRALEKRIYIGQAMIADTLPEKSGFRCVVMFDEDSKWTGYLWKEDQLCKPWVF